MKSTAALDRLNIDGLSGVSETTVKERGLIRTPGWDEREVALITGRDSTNRFNCHATCTKKQGRLRICVGKGIFQPWHP